MTMREESSRVLRSQAARAGNLTSPGGTTMPSTLCTRRATRVGLFASKPICESEQWAEVAPKQEPGYGYGNDHRLALEVRERRVEVNE